MNSKPNSKKPFTNMNPYLDSVNDVTMHSQSKSNKNPSLFNHFLRSNPQNQIQPAQEKKDLQENKTQLFPNTANKNPFLDKNNSTDNKNGIIRIQVYKSHLKPHRAINPNEIGESAKLLLKRKTEVKEEVRVEQAPLIQEQNMDKKIQYKMLIKKIAMQLRKKIRPRTRGYFYMKVIRNEKYMNIVKRIALSIKNKLGIHPPTNGAFYSYMKKEEEMKLKKEKEEKYKLLIKKISTQLKKRVKLPTCKIIKVYESYRILIKRIASALKQSIKNRSIIPDSNQISKMEQIKEEKDENLIIQEEHNEVKMDLIEPNEDKIIIQEQSNENKEEKEDIQKINEEKIVIQEPNKEKKVIENHNKEKLIEEINQEKIIVKEQDKQEKIASQEQNKEEKIIKESNIEENIIIPEQQKEGKTITQEQNEEKIVKQEPIDEEKIIQESNEQIIIVEEPSEEKLKIKEQNIEEVKEDNINEKPMDIDININNIEKEKEKEILNPNNIIKEESSEESNKMDIETNTIVVNPPQINAIQTEFKNEPVENNEIKAMTYNQNSNWISSSKKKSEENIVSNYTFSKMEVLENNELINSSEQKRPCDLNFKDSTENKIITQEQKDIPEMKINTDEFISPEKQEEIKVEKENVIEKKEYTEVKKNEKTYDNVDKQKIKSAKSKSHFCKPSLIRKEDFYNINFDRKKANKSHARINVNFNLENLHEMYTKISRIENKEVAGDNINLQDIEATKSNFINQFQKFLEQENIEIVNNFPVSTSEKNIYLFQQSNFWYLVITYLFYKNTNITPYNIFYLLDQYNTWSKDKNIEIFNSIKERIKNYFISNYSKESLSQFLFMNKLENLDQIFAKYELLNENIDNNNNIYETIKVDNINYFYDRNKAKCECNLCKSDEACIQKVCDLNKTRMEIVNNPSIDYFKKEITSEDIIKKNNSCIMFHNNEELFYKGKSKQKPNTIFSQSKTILENEGFLEYIPEPSASLPKPQTEKKNEKIEHTTENKENITENIEKEKNYEIIDNNKDITEQEKKASSSEDSPKKTFKNIYKSERKPKDEEEKNVEIMSEGKEPLELKDEEENSEDESKNVKKEKKSRKGKSRKKNNNNNKKKKDSITKERNAMEKEENVNEEQHEEEKEDKSVKKKRKSTNRSSLKKNKSKICAKDNNIEKGEMAQSEEIDLGTRSAHKFVEDTTVNNSKRKKSKTPNKKKSRKH